MDYYLFQQINNLAGHWAWLDALAVFLASYFQYILAGLLLIFLLVGKNQQEKEKNRLMVGLAFLAAGISRFGFGEIVKQLVDRPRPFEVQKATQLISYAAGESFPSGHALFFFALATVVYSYNKKFGWIFFGSAFLIGLSRIFAGIHYPSDILGGALIGVFTGWLVVKMARRFLKQKEQN